MPIASVDSVSVDVITTLIEDGFDDAVRDMRMQSQQNSLWEQFTRQEEANGAKEVLQVWMEDINAMEEWLSGKKFQDLVERRYKISHTPWHAGVRMNLKEMKERIKQFGGGDTSVGVDRFAADIRDKLVHRASELDIVKVLAELTSPTKLGYDGQALFSAAHPDGGGQSNQNTGGGGQYWYLMALGGRGRPIIRLNGGVNESEFAIRDHVNEDTSERFFKRDLYWSVEFDGGWFPGLWQTIYRSNQTLDAANLDAAIQAMSNFKDARGEQMGLVPTHVLVGRSNWRTARVLLNTTTVATGGENPDSGIVTPIYSARLA